MLFFTLFSLFSCRKEVSQIRNEKSIPDLNLDTKAIPVSVSPFSMTTPGVRFYSDLPYGVDDRHKFDLFLPDSEGKIGLVLFIHGGGFTSGDKSMAYTNPRIRTLIKDLMDDDIAFVSINYHLLGINGQEGVLKTMEDCKLALQYLRHHARILHLDTDKIVLVGGSAGAGASLWLGLNDDMADMTSPNGILRETTRVKGVVAIQTQGNYDLVNWHNTVFDDYLTQGFSFQTVKSLVSESLIMKFYGINQMSELNTPQIIQDRANLDYLNKLSSDDPELYIENTGVSNSYPTYVNSLLHHPLQGKVLMDKANAVNLSTKVYLPTMNIDTRNGESVYDFIVRKIEE